MNLLTVFIICCVLSVMVISRDACADGRVLYAPDVLGVGRLFMVAIETPLDAPASEIAVPKEVTLLDQTPLPAKSTIRRYYFRTASPGEGVKITFGHPLGPVEISVDILSFEQLNEYRTLKGVQLPRRWPLGKPLPELKESQTMTTKARKDATRKAGGGVSWGDVSDEDIWNLQPDSTIPRWHWVNIQHGCPVHGTEIYSAGPYYPWIKDISIPYSWKIKCPIGDENYPSNDLSKDDFTSGEFPDDAIGGGYAAPDGKRYGFAAELSQRYCHQMLSVAPACADAYLRTGEIKYVHKALVAFCRLAVEYAYLSTMTQHRHRNTADQVERFGQGRFDEGPCLSRSGFTVYCIDQPNYQVSSSEAYDIIFDAIDQDSDIVPFMRSKGFTDIETTQDVRRFIETYLFAVWIQGSMDGANDSNPPFTQWGAVKMAQMLNYKTGTDFVDWLYDGTGQMRTFVPNGFFRDGAPYESTGNYNSMHVRGLVPIVDAIEKIRALRPEIYTKERYPAISDSRRYHNIFDFCMDTVLIDRTFPLIGDGGDPPSYSKLGKISYNSANDDCFEGAYTLYKDPKFAWALANSPTWNPSVDFPYTREQIETEAAKLPDTWNDASSIHPGFGIAILRNGKGDNKRALWMKYGMSRGHTQDDLLDIGLAANEGTILQHMGYPRNWGYWEYAWSSHNVGRIFPYDNFQIANAELFADTETAQVCEARSYTHGEWRSPGKQDADLPNNWQRRLLALVNAGEDRFYCVDFYRIFGGKEHWRSLHCQEGDVEITGLNLVKQERGTLAGEDVPYGDEQWLKEHSTGENVYGFLGPEFPFPWLYNVQKASPEGGWTADWKLKTSDGLHFKLSVAQSEGVLVNICDGKAPSGGSPYEMKWLMLHNKSEQEVKSQTLSLMETYKEEPTIKKVENLSISGEDGEGFRPAACTVHLANRKDTLFVSSDSDIVHSAEGGFLFAGRFGLYAEKDGKPSAISLVGGTRISKNGVGISIEKPEYQGKITEVDRENEKITISPAPPIAAAMNGATIFLCSGNKKVAYKVLGVESVQDGAVLSLNLDSKIGVGRVTGAEDFKVCSHNAFNLQHYGYYENARIVNQENGAEYKINEVRWGEGAYIDPVTAPEATKEKLEAEFPSGSWFDVYDYGVGDEVVWQYCVSVVRTDSGEYRVDSPVPVRVNLPK